MIIKMGLIMKFMECEVLVRGANFDKLLNELANKNLRFKASKIDETCLKIEINRIYLKILIDLLKQKCYSYNIPNSSSIGTKVFGCLIGMVLGVAIYLVLGSFCLGYKISTNDGELATQIEAVLDAQNLTFKSWSEINCKYLENELLTNIDNLALVSVSRVGVFLMINMDKATPKTGKYTPNSSNGGIFANQNGVVSRMFVSSGTPLVKVGDSVVVGQLLVAPYKQEEEERVDVVAKADIYLYTWESNNIEFCEETYEYSRTGRQKTACVTYFNDNLLKKDEINIDFEHFDEEITTCNLSSIIPIKTEFHTYYETEPVLVIKKFEDEKEGLVYLAKQKFADMDQSKILDEKYTISCFDGIYNVTYYVKIEIKI